jgi:glutathione S-transferase
MLEEIGQPYKAEVKGYGPAMKSPAYLAVNPMGKVPAIRHGDTVVTECAAILAYLADAFPAAGLAPPVTSKLRGEYYRWLFFAAGPLEAAVADKAIGAVVPSDKKGMVGYGSMADVLDTLEKAVSGKTYLVGSSFTAADLYLGSHLGWGLQFGTIEKRPAFVAYHEHFRTRPAAIRANKIDDDLMPQYPMPRQDA